MYRSALSRRAPQIPRARWVRHNSSTTTTESAKAKAAEAGKAAQEKGAAALASAQKGASQVVDRVKSLSGKVGEQAGNLLGGYRAPVLYNLAVAREVLKQIYIKESLAPPTSVSTWQSAYSTLYRRATNVNYWRELARSGQWVRVGVYGLEAYFVFHIGEMVGRRSIVGYKVDA